MANRESVGGEISEMLGLLAENDNVEDTAFYGPQHTEFNSFEYFNLNEEAGEAEANNNIVEGDCWGCDHEIEPDILPNTNIVRDKIWAAWTGSAKLSVDYRCKQVQKAHDMFVVQPALKRGLESGWEPWTFDSIKYHFTVCLQLADVRVRIANKRTQTVIRELMGSIKKRNNVTGESVIDSKAVDGFCKLLKLEADLLKNDRY